MENFDDWLRHYIRASMGWNRETDSLYDDDAVEAHINGLTNAELVSWISMYLSLELT